LKTAASSSGSNRCQGIAFGPTPPSGILRENLPQKLPRESEIGAHGIFKRFAVQSPMQRREYAPVKETLHLLAGVTGRNQIESQIHHRLDQTVNPLASHVAGPGGNYAARAHSQLATDGEDPSVCIGNALLRWLGWAGKWQAARRDCRKLIVFRGSEGGRSSRAMGPVAAHHHCPQRLGEFLKSFARDRHFGTAFLVTLQVENADYEIDIADSLDLF
jgi:hypothetical protein